eukprot:g14671.t1
MAATELSELRAELWRTRDDLERIKSRGTPPSAERSPRRLFDRRMKSSAASPSASSGASKGRKADRSTRRHWHESSAGVADKRRDADRGGSGSGEGGGGTRSGSTSPPTSGDSSPGSDAENNDRSYTKALESTRTSSGARIRGSPATSRAGRKHRTYRGTSASSGEDAWRGSPEEAAAEETLCNLELEGAAFKNWTEEASSIAVRLIEEVKMLRWEKASWEGRQRAAEREAERAAAELGARADHLEERLRSVEEDRRESQAALARAQQDADNERARAKVEREKADRLRAAAAAQQERERIPQQQQQQPQAETAAGSLADMLRREKEGADALQRRLDAARAASAGHERERKEWRSSRARLEELRRSWGKQLKRVEKKMRSMAKENTALHARVSEAERARDRADAEALHHRDTLRRLTEQRDQLLLGATRLGGGRDLSASSPADALAELLAAAAGVVADAGGGVSGVVAGGDRPRTPAEQLQDELEQARSEAKLARVAAQQERLRRDAAAREKEEAVRQLHRLMGAARRAVGKRDARLRSSRMETEVVWNALTEAVR